MHNFTKIDIDRFLLYFSGASRIKIFQYATRWEVVKYSNAHKTRQSAKFYYTS